MGAGVFKNSGKNSSNNFKIQKHISDLELESYIPKSRMCHSFEKVSILAIKKKDIQVISEEK